MIKAADLFCGAGGASIGARLDEFKLLKNGWLEGKGRAPNAEQLDWLAETFDGFFPDGLTAPYFYPTSEGGVQAEWTIIDSEASLEIDLKKRTSNWHLLKLETDEESEAELDLSKPEDWLKLAKLLKELFGGNQE